MEILESFDFLGINLSLYITSHTHNLDKLRNTYSDYLSGKNEKRGNEFLTGRLCAHKAMENAGINPLKIVQDTKGIPVWPDNVTGSISHSKNLAAALITGDKNCLSTGIDIEDTSRIISKQAMDIFLNEDEFYLTENSKIKPGVLFSLKESVLKAFSLIYHDGVFFDFFSVKVHNENVKIFNKIELSLFTCTAKKNTPLLVRGGYFFINNECVSFCTITPF